MGRRRAGVVAGAALAVWIGAAGPAAAHDFTWTGPAGALTYRFTPRTGTLRDLEILHNGAAIRPSNYGGIVVLGRDGQTIRPAQGLHAARILEESVADGAVRVVYRWSGGGLSFDFSMAVRLSDKTLVLDFEAAPQILDVLEFGLDRSEHTPHPKVVELPYGHNVLFTGGLFVSALLDPAVSNASSIAPMKRLFSSSSAFFGETACYEPLTDGRRHPLRERVLITASPEIADTFRRPDRPPSPWRDALSRTVVLDLWRSPLPESAAGIEDLASLGMRDILAIVHMWQKYGYDNGLPSTLPAGDIYGGDASLQILSESCRRNRFRLGLHTNYVDFYPNSDLWDPADVALNPAGRFVSAWFNPSTLVQSFLLKPSRAAAYARTVEPEIHGAYGTSAAFLDVHTALLPSWVVDYDARAPGAGRQAAVFDHYRDLVAEVRAIHDGPLAGEGFGFAAPTWAGVADILDGDPQSLFDRSGNRGGGGVPTLVDYKLAALHGLSAFSGAGYLERFFPGRWSGFTPEDHERYRATAIAFGNAGFLSDPFARGQPALEILRDYCFQKTVQSRALNAAAAEILYDVRGALMPLSEALRFVLPAAAFQDVPDLLCEELGLVRIAYDSGLVVCVNRSRGRTWSIDADGRDGLLLPSDFLVLEGGRLLACSAWIDGRREYYIEPSSAEASCAGRLDGIIESPLALAGRRVTQRSLFLLEHIDVLTWQPHPANRNISRHRVYAIENGARTLIGETAADGRPFLRRRAPAEAAADYAVSAVNAEGREGRVAYVTVR